MTKRKLFGKVYNCHVNREVLLMFNDENQAVEACSEEPSLIFKAINLGEYDIVKHLVDDNLVSINTCDGVGNDIVTRLLKAKQYDLVIDLIKKRNWNVNNQNYEGNTFGHFLVLDNSVGALRVMEQLVKKKNFLPNIKNSKGETMLDIAINSNYIYTVMKIIEDKRFNDISLITFKKLCKLCIKNTYFGKYSRLNNLEVIVDSLEKKNLEPPMQKVLSTITDNMDMIKGDIMKNRTSILENIINTSMEEAI